MVAHIWDPRNQWQSQKYVNSRPFWEIPSDDPLLWVHKLLEIGTKCFTLCPHLYLPSFAEGNSHNTILSLESSCLRGRTKTSSREHHHHHPIQDIPESKGAPQNRSDHQLKTASSLQAGGTLWDCLAEPMRPYLTSTPQLHMPGALSPPLFNQS